KGLLFPLAASGHVFGVGPRRSIESSSKHLCASSVRQFRIDACRRHEADRRRDGERRAFSGGKPMTFPTPLPEIPAANVDKAAAYYINMLGFTFDWGDDQGGIAGISRGDFRLFITNRSFRESYGNIGPILFWFNLDSNAEVDELFAQWKAAQP